MNFDPVTASLYGTAYSSFEPTHNRNNSVVDSVGRKFFGFCTAVSGVAFFATGSPIALSFFCISVLLALSFTSSRTSRVYVDTYQPRQDPPVVILNQNPPRQQERVVYVDRSPPRQRSPVVLEDLFARHQPDSLRRQETVVQQRQPRPRQDSRQERVVVLEPDVFEPTAQPVNFAERHQPESQQRHERVVELPQNPFVPTGRDPFERHQPDSTRQAPATPSPGDPFERHEVGK